MPASGSCGGATRSRMGSTAAAQRSPEVSCSSASSATRVASSSRSSAGWLQTTCSASTRSTSARRSSPARRGPRAAASSAIACSGDRAQAVAPLDQLAEPAEVVAVTVAADPERDLVNAGVGEVAGRLDRLAARAPDALDLLRVTADLGAVIGEDLRLVLVDVAIAEAVPELRVLGDEP